MASHFERLPDEIVLNILERLRPAPLSPSCSGLDVAAGRAYNTRRWNDHQKNITQLYDISLVSKQLHRVTESVLYSSIVVRTSGRTAYLRISCLLTALAQKPYRARSIKYLENTDAHSSSELWSPPALLQYYSQKQCDQDRPVLIRLAQGFWKDDLLQDWLDFFNRDSSGAAFVLLIALAPNIDRLSIVEPLLRGPLPFLLPGTASTSSNGAYHGFKKLDTLSISSQASAREDDRYVAQFLQGLPALQHYRHVQPRAAHFKRVPSNFFKRLTNVCFEKCQLTISQVAIIVKQCRVLEDFSCTWSPECRGDGFDWLQLLTALHRSRRTLKKLSLKFSGDVPTYDQQEIFPAQLGQSDALVHLTELKDLSLSAYMLLGQRDGGISRRADHVKPKVPISQCLPRKLDVLEIQSTSSHSPHCFRRLTVNHLAVTDSDVAMWNLVEDLQMFPTLRQVRITRTLQAPFMTSPEKTTELIEAFGQKGVEFVPPRDCCDVE